MQGLINLKTVLAHPFIIIKEYGIRLWLRCVVSAFFFKKRVTFLSIVFQEKTMKCYKCHEQEATYEEIICDDCLDNLLNEENDYYYQKRELENGYKHDNGPEE
jgi:hypothetical protein